MTKVLNQEMIVEKQAGYRCQACNVVNVLYADKTPTECINCGAKVFKKEWEHLLRTIETIESV